MGCSFKRVNYTDLLPRRIMPRSVRSGDFLLRGRNVQGPSPKRFQTPRALSLARWFGVSHSSPFSTLGHNRRYTLVVALAQRRKPGKHRTPSVDREGMKFIPPSGSDHDDRRRLPSMLAPSRRWRSQREGLSAQLNTSLGAILRSLGTIQIVNPIYEYSTQYCLRTHRFRKKVR